MLNLLKGDCFEQMATIEPGSVSLVLTDPPYGNMGGLGRGVVEAAGKYKRFREETTEWDTALDPERLKREVARVLRDIHGPQDQQPCPKPMSKKALQALTQLEIPLEGAK